MRTIKKIIDKVDCSRGAPMGRSSVYPQNYMIVDPGAPHKFLVCPNTKESKRIFDCAVPLTEGYDAGGAYWGIPSNLRVSYTKDLTYIHFYRN